VKGPNNFEIREIRRVDFRNAILIDGFPSIGLVSSIVSNYLIALLRLEYVGFIDSPYFPAVTFIRDSIPMAPARLYARSDALPGDQQLAIFTSEFQPSQNITKPLGMLMIDWAQQNHCKLIVSVGGLVIERETNEKNEAAAEADQVAVYGIGSTPRAEKYLAEADVEPFVEGVITGTSGMLLREGKKRGFDVVVLLTEARQNVADAKAAVLLAAAIDDMVLKMNLELDPLLREAEKLEEKLAILRRQADSRARNFPEGGPAGYQ